MENEIIIGVVVALFSGILGWSLSQLTVGRKIEQSIADTRLLIEKCSNDAHRAQDEVAQLRFQTTAQVTSMTSLVEKVLETANKLIDLVRIQNALLNKKSNE